jgi:UDP-N-acetylmuramate dehydrogenase
MPLFEITFSLRYNKFMISEKIIKNYPLAQLSTFKIGGNAEFFIEIREKDELMESIVWAGSEGLKISLIGGCSNVLISDKGVKGLLIKIAYKESRIEGEFAAAGAGANLSSLVILSKDAGLAGLEWAVGIPGTVGGAVRGNAGAYGASMGVSVEEVEAFDKKSGKFMILKKEDCGFKYRSSIFAENQDLIIWKIRLKLEIGDKKKIADKMLEIIEKRRKKIPTEPSAGSVFKNLSADGLEADNPELYESAITENSVLGGMVPAAWVLEKSGLKGKRIGGAAVSEKHANFIINTGGATSEEVIMLISFIKQQIRTKYNLQLREEIEYLGFE